MRHHKALFKFAIKAGEIMLRNGAETYRVEDTIERILRTQDLEIVESFVTPTGIFATMDEEDGETVTVVKRVRKRTIHLHKVALINHLSRQFVEGSLTLEEASQTLQEIESRKPYPPAIMIMSIGLAASFFTVVFGGSLRDFCSSLLIGIFLALLQQGFYNSRVSRFLVDLLGGSLIAVFALLFVNTGLGAQLDKIIIGSIMPLVPGVAITNAVRDTIEGDLVSGISRGVEAFFIAVSIAAGVGIVLKIWFAVNGGYIV